MTRQAAQQKYGDDVDAWLAALERGVEVVDDRLRTGSLPGEGGDEAPEQHAARLDAWVKREPEHVYALKQDYPEQDDASVLLEPKIAYDDLIQAMDAVRSVESPASGGAEATRVALFTNIAVGDAP